MHTPRDINSNILCMVPPRVDVKFEISTLCEIIQYSGVFASLLQKP
jgi:hypothetical protein